MNVLIPKLYKEFNYLNIFLYIKFFNIEDSVLRLAFLAFKRGSYQKALTYCDEAIKRIEKFK